MCGAGSLTQETMNKFQDTFGIPIVEGYGLTEGTCVSTINPRDGVRKIGSIGIALPGQEVLIVDEQDNEVPTGERGEIVIKGDNDERVFQQARRNRQNHHQRLPAHRRCRYKGRGRIYLYRRPVKRHDHPGR
ncbi:MAG: AMP-binding protein [Desulfobacterales bacterium]